MDIVTHAVVGAASGALFGQPLLGAAVATMPDWPLLGRRVKLPPFPYVVLHSPLVMYVVICMLPIDDVLFSTILLSYVSHIALDIPTHSKTWQPRFIPFKESKLDDFEEWEFFNSSWWFGLTISIFWTILCLTFAFLFDTGSPS